MRIGKESYAFLGPLHRQPGPSVRTSTTFVVADFNFRRRDFNVGVGKSLGVSSDEWLVKAIIVIPLD